MKSTQATSFIIGLLLLESNVQADSFLHKGGSIIEGRCLNAGDKNATEWQIETESGLLISLKRSEITDFRPETAEQKQYAEALAKRDDSLEVHRKFVEACSKLGIFPLADAHRERIVELDPNDRTAWSALGYLETEEEGWMRKDLFQKRRGLQQKGKIWYIPQDLAIQEGNEQAKKVSAQVSKDVSRALSDVRAKNANATRARQEVEGLHNPLALPKLREFLINDRSNKQPQFRVWLIGVISRIPSSDSVQVLIDSAVSDPDPIVRSECVARLSDSEQGREIAIQVFSSKLVNRNPERDQAFIYNRVGDALREIGDERCLPKLLDCLVTNHIQTPPPQPAYQAGKTSDGNMGFSTGSKKREKVRLNNEGVLHALQSISQEDFGYDVQAWQNWYAKHYAAPNPYVLRDP